MVNPATEQTVCQVGYCGQAETQRAVEAADKAFAPWRALTPYQREEPLRRSGELLRGRAEEIATALTMAQGKPLAEARLEFLATAGFFEWYAEEGTRLYGEIVPSHFGHKRLFVFHQPIGVCAMIAPWNFPLFLQGRKIAPALAAGCTCVCRLGRLEKGYFVEPTVITDITPEMEIMHEEPFCPVMPIIPFKTPDEALQAANDTPYGLASYVATREVATAIKMAERLETGIISIGDFSPATVLCPFGGMKESGIGREGGREGILEYVESQYVSLAMDA